jgi:hypothetical protein
MGTVQHPAQAYNLVADLLGGPQMSAFRRAFALSGRGETWARGRHSNPSAVAPMTTASASGHNRSSSLRAASWPWLRLRAFRSRLPETYQVVIMDGLRCFPSPFTPVAQHLRINEQRMDRLALRAPVDAAEGVHDEQVAIRICQVAHALRQVLRLVARGTRGFWRARANVARENSLSLRSISRRSARRWAFGLTPSTRNAFVEPAMMMTVDEYQAALCSTRASWREVIG